MNKWLITSLIFLSTLQAQAFEDCVITTKGKLTDIKVKDNSLLQVSPLVTLMNEKNTLIVSPLMAGETSFCVLKDDKDIVMFNVNITEEKTTISSVKGFEILTLDNPFEEIILDKPPLIKEVN